MTGPGLPVANSPSVAPRSKADGVSLAAAPACAAWVALAGMHLLLSRLIPGTAVQDQSAPAWVQLGLIGVEFSLAAAFMGALLLLRLGVARLERIGWGSRAVVVGTALRILVTAALIIGYVASWISFSEFGHFADLQGVEFAWVNGSIFFAYVHATHPALLFWLPLGALLLAALVVVIGPLLFRRIPLPLQKRGSRLTLGIAGCCLLATLAIHLLHGRSEEGVRDPLTGVTVSWGRMYECRRDATSG
ncbi:MAG TPA: hypothetical protein VKW04_21220, partial [Planctomycetota bacterium]|nr:hypothetical protein [Planctomycetota bacterium]